MPDIHNLQHDESDLRKALGTNDAVAATIAREHLSQDFAAFAGNGTALAAYDQLVAADSAKHLQPLVLYDSHEDGLDARPDVDKKVHALHDTDPSACDQAIVNEKWSKEGKGSLTDIAKQDAVKMMQSPEGLESFKQHLRDASTADGNPGESAYVDAVNKQLTGLKSDLQVDLAAQSTAISMQPGEYGSFKIAQAGKENGAFIQF